MARLEGIRDFHRMPRPQLCSQSCFDDVDDDTETDSETEAEEVMDVALEIARRKDLLADAALAETRLRSMFHVRQFQNWSASDSFQRVACSKT